MTPPLQAPIPILRSFDAAQARDFYLRYLGFAVLFEHRFDADAPLYMAIARDGCVLHLSEHHGDAVPGAALRIGCADVRAFHAEITARSHPGQRPGLDEQPWGQLECRLTDPFANRLIFCQDL